MRHLLIALAFATVGLVTACDPPFEAEPETQASGEAQIPDVSFPAHPYPEDALNAQWAAERAEAGAPAPDAALLAAWEEANRALYADTDAAPIAYFTRVVQDYALAQGAAPTMVQGDYAFDAFITALDATLAAAQAEGVAPTAWLAAHPEDPVALAHAAACGDILDYSAAMGLLDADGGRAHDDLGMHLLWRARWASTVTELLHGQGPQTELERGALARWRAEHMPLPIYERIEAIHEAADAGQLPYSVGVARGVIFAQEGDLAGATAALERALHEDPTNTEAQALLDTLTGASR